MKSTTNKTNPKYYNFIGIGLIVAIVVVLFAGRFFRAEKRNDIVFLDARPIHNQYGWGYDILANGQLYIHQETIPAISGKKGFETKDDALQVATRVISKIKAKQIPPAMTIEELMDMGVIKDSMVSK